VPAITLAAVTEISAICLSPMMGNAR